MWGNMIRISNISMYFEKDENEKNIYLAIGKKLKTKEKFEYKIVKKAIDARKREEIKFVYTVDVTIKDEKKYLKLKDVSETSDFIYKVGSNVEFKERPVVVGSGPAGLFCALNLARAGANPIIIEQGSKVDSRKEKVDKFFKIGELDIYNNIQFGEGGAGTFSDGKLTTNIKDKRIKFILETFVENGAPKEILYKSKPHIGTNYLVDVVKNIRVYIENLGGKFLFDTKFLDFKNLENNTICLELENVITEEKQSLITGNLVLAMGHSARDTFEMLYNNGVTMEAKPFSVGFRIEHLQKFIDETQYNKEIAKDSDRLKVLGSAEYKINAHLDNGKGVYTFCMCPGGNVVNAASEKNTVLTNGMSNFERDEVNANSAILLSVNKKDYESLTGETNELSGIAFQRHFEKLAFELGGSNYNAPVQKVRDFVNNIETTDLGKVKPTIKPNYKFVDFNKYLPNEISRDLKEGLLLLNGKIKNFIDNDAIITGFETRSSSPVKFYRTENYETSVKNLYVCGEGCGFAGGITSSSVDGLKCAEKILGNS